MLVLCRQEDEEIIIGDPARPLAVVRVVQIKGDKVRLGVTADQSTLINRREIADRMLSGLPIRNPRSASSPK